MTNTRRIVIPRGRKGLKGDKGDPGDGAATLGVRVDLLESPTAQNVIYWNGVSGNDANSGGNVTPVQTAQRVCELLRAGTTNMIFLQSDVVWDYYLDIQNDIKIDISGGPSTHYSITFTDAINNSNRKGGMRIEAYGTLVLLYTNIILAGTRNEPIFNASIGKWKCRTFSTGFESLPNSMGSVFSNGYGGEIFVHFQGYNFENMDQSLFEGIASGANPNERNLVYCNLTNV